MNISGVLVYAAPKQADSVANKLSAIEGVEVHAVEDGKLVVTIEHGNIKALADQVMEFQYMPGVASVAMVYQHNEDDESLNAEEIIVEEPASCTASACNEHISQEALS